MHLIVSDCELRVAENIRGAIGPKWRGLHEKGRSRSRSARGYLSVKHVKAGCSKVQRDNLPPLINRDGGDIYSPIATILTSIQRNSNMTDSIELPVLTHLGHGRPSSRSSTRISDVVVTSATMGYGASTTLGRVEAQEDVDLAQINTNDSAESDPLLLRGKIVSEGELSEIRK